MANGCSREQAMDLLDDHGCDAEACLAWLLEQQQAAEAQADPAAVAELLANGLTVADAEAALHHCNNDVDLVGGGRGVVERMAYGGWRRLGRSCLCSCWEATRLTRGHAQPGSFLHNRIACLCRRNESLLQALAWAADCLEAGGPAAVAGLSEATAEGRGRTVLAAGKSVAARRRRGQRAEREAQHRRLQQESSGVLERFASGGLRKEQVHRIQRVQNKELWEDYLRSGKLFGWAAGWTDLVSCLSSHTRAAATPPDPELLRRADACMTFTASCRRRGKVERTLSKSTGGARMGALLNERKLFHGADKVWRHAAGKMLRNSMLALRDDAVAVRANECDMPLPTHVHERPAVWSMPPC